MLLSKTRIVQTYAETAVRHFLKTYKLDSTISSNRVTNEVLSKFHFKVKPLTTEVKIYNDLFIKKGRNPESQEEFEQWIKEGAIAFGVPNHLVQIVNEKTLVDLSINQQSKDIQIPPLVCDVTSEFLLGQKPIVIENLTCVMVYEAFPNDKVYQTKKEWFDKSVTKQIIREIYAEVQEILEIDRKAKNEKVVGSV